MGWASMMAAAICVACTGRAIGQERRTEADWRADVVRSSITRAVRRPEIVQALQPAVALSPQGTSVAYAVRQSRLSNADLRQSVQTVFFRTGIHILGVNGRIALSSLTSGDTTIVSAPDANSYQPVWSPDGRWLAFYSDEGGKAGVWLWDSVRRQRHRLGQAEARPLDTSSLFWTPDGRALLVRLAPSRKVVQLEGDVEAVPTRSENVKVFDGGPARGTNGTDTIVKEPEQIDDLFLTDLALIDIQTSKLTRIAVNVRVRSFWLSPDGARVAFTTPIGTRTGDSGRRLFDIYVKNLASASAEEPTRVAHEVQMAIYGSTVSWSPAGDTLAVGIGEGLHTEAGRNTTGDCLLIDVNSGQTRKATQAAHPYFGHTYRPPIWSRDGKSLWLLAGRSVLRIDVASGALSTVEMQEWTPLDIARPRGASVAWTADAADSVIITARKTSTREQALIRVSRGDDGPSTTVLWKGQASFSNRVVLHFDAQPAGERAVLIAEDANTPEVPWVFSATHRTLTPLTSPQAQQDAPAVARRELVEWRTPDGNRVGGVVVLPSTWQGGAPLPFVVTFYPGSRCTDNASAFRVGDITRPQLFTERGIGILCVDAPFSGRGLKRDVVNAVLSGVEAAVERGFADPARLGLIGWSMGGYGVMLVLTEAARFSAAVEVSGFADPTSWFLTFSEGGIDSAAGVLQDRARLGTTPWDNPQRYIDYAPIYKLQDIDTPLLIVHGAKDGAVPVGLGEQLFAGLNRLGKTVRLVRYEKEGHGIVDPTDEEDMWFRILTWFHEHMDRGDKPGAVTASK